MVNVQQLAKVFGIFKFSDHRMQPPGGFGGSEEISNQSILAY